MPAGGPFPDTASGTRAVLYQTEDGGIQLRWHIAAADIAHAEAAFAQSGDAPTALLILKRVHSGGDSRPIANATLDHVSALSTGVAHYDATVAEGAVQAELGLASGDGGWVLVARSNRLESSGPVGAGFLQRAHAPSHDAGSAATPQAHAGMAGRAITQLNPEFPLVAAHPGAESARGAAIAPTSGSFDLRAARALSGGATSIGAGAHAAEPHAAAAGKPRLGGAWGSAGAPSLAVEHATAREPGLDADIGASGRADERDAGEDRGPIAGSGPLRSPRADIGMLVGAELLVHGSAAPDSVVELGGHRYRVGPGGRFSFRVPVSDHALLAEVLSRVPALPVESRPASEKTEDD